MIKLPACQKLVDEKCVFKDIGGITCCHRGGLSNSDYVRCEWFEKYKQAYMTWKKCPGGRCIGMGISKRDGDLNRRSMEDSCGS